MSPEYSDPVFSDEPAFQDWDGERWYFNKRMGYYLNRAGSLLHRSIWTKVHGPIPDGHEINHINRKRWDNRLANFELFTVHDHRSLTATQQGEDSAWRANQTSTAATERLSAYWQRREPREVGCIECGASFFSTGMRAKFCSASCRNKNGRERNRRERAQRAQGGGA